MTTFELTAEVGTDHRLIVDVPNSCPPGRHRVLLLVDSPVEATDPSDVTSPAVAGEETTTELVVGPFAWENGVLVYTGDWIGPPVEDVVEWEREQRMRDILGEEPDADSR